ncbi:MAG: hypothetical protein K8U57_26235 [Planctomycetes bacterium]|nr:hypothetical protein [Planctomycetota bacterium]
MKTTSLNRLARRASTDPFFLGFRLAEYSRVHELDDAALAGRLGCQVELLPTIRLCRAPRTDPAGFREDVLCVAEKFGLNSRALAEASKFGFVAIRLENTPAEMPGVFLAARDRNES